MRTVNVPLGERSYPIHIGQNILQDIGSICRDLGLRGPCAVITDNNVAPHYCDLALASLRMTGIDAMAMGFAPGEGSKNLEVVQKCYDNLAKHRLERKSFIVALGGGVVGDLAGFVAATYLRGIPFVQVPTTLLSQVDSSVGGKVGVNLKAGKNLVGAFYQPKVVLCDLATLNTLPLRELRSGLAEVIKYGIIYDEALFARLERDLPDLLERDPTSLAQAVARCCEIKADVVRQDEHETGLRAILNFGHTIGHAIEAISGYGKYLHGEAISIGQVAAARLSTQLTGFAKTDATRIEKLFKRAGLPTKIRLSATQKKRLLDAMLLDKKVSGGEVKFVLARRLGQVEPGHKVSRELILDALAN